MMDDAFARGIPFTQFLRPNGKRLAVYVVRPEPVTEKARAIVAAGYVFECEEMMSGIVSFTIVNPRTEEDVAHELCRNGPAVLVAVDKLITEFALP